MWRNHAKPTRLIRKYRWYILIFLNIRCQDLVQPTSHSSITTHTVGPQVVGDVTTDRKWPNDHVGKIYFLQADRGSNLYTEHLKIAACFCITVCCMSQSFMILFITRFPIYHEPSKCLRPTVALLWRRLRTRVLSMPTKARAKYFIW